MICVCSVGPYSKLMADHMICVCTVGPYSKLMADHMICVCTVGPYSKLMTDHIIFMSVVNTPPLICVVNPLSPHDALKHHFTSRKTDLIFLQLGVLE